MDDVVIVVDELSEQIVVQENKLQKSGVLLSSISQDSKLTGIYKLNSVSFLLLTLANFDQILHLSKDHATNNVKFSLKKQYYTKNSAYSFIGLNLNTSKIQQSDCSQNIYETTFSNEKADTTFTVVAAASTPTTPTTASSASTTSTTNSTSTNSTSTNSTTSTTTSADPQQPQGESAPESTETTTTSTPPSAGSNSSCSPSPSKSTQFVQGDPSISNDNQQLICSSNKWNVVEIVKSYKGGSDSASVVTFFTQNGNLPALPQDFNLQSHSVSDDLSTEHFNVNFNTKTVDILYQSSLNVKNQIVGAFNTELLQTQPLHLFQEEIIVEKTIDHQQQVDIDALNSTASYLSFSFAYWDLFLRRMFDTFVQIENEYVFALQNKLRQEFSSGSYNQTVPVEKVEFNLYITTQNQIRKQIVTLRGGGDQKDLSNKLANSVSLLFNVDSNSQQFKIDGYLLIRTGINLQIYNTNTNSIQNFVLDSDTTLYNINQCIQSINNNILRLIDLSKNKISCNQTTLNFKNFFVVQTSTNVLQVQTINPENKNSLILKQSQTYPNSNQSVYYLNTELDHQRKFHIEKDILFINQQQPVIAIVQQNQLKTDQTQQYIDFVDLSTQALIETYSLNKVSQPSLVVLSRFNELIASQYNTKSQRNEVVSFKLFYNVDLNSSDALDTFNSLEGLINAGDKLDQSVQVHQQMLISPEGIVDIVAVQSKNNFQPSSFLIKLADSRLLMCSSLGKLYSPHVTAAEILKFSGVADKLPYQLLQKSLGCLSVIGETKNAPVDFRNQNFVNVVDSESHVEQLNQRLTDGLLLTWGNQVNVYFQELHKNISDFPKDMGTGLLWSILGMGVVAYVAWNMRASFKF